MKEYKEQPLYKQYLSEFVTALVILTVISGCLIGLSISLNPIEEYILNMFLTISFIIVLGFATVITINFSVKRLDLLKEYYEEKTK